VSNAEGTVTSVPDLKATVIPISAVCGMFILGGAAAWFFRRKFCRYRNKGNKDDMASAQTIPRCSVREAIRAWTMKQHLCTWRNLTGHRHGKLFISGPCIKRASNLLKLSRWQLKMVVAILTGHAPVRKHLHTMHLFEGDPTCRFCGKETETVQHIICCCEALARQRYNVFGSLEVEPTDIRTASVRDLCLLTRGTGLQFLS
jgi:hypothetical protein